jgi:hypothetical protein
MAFPTGPHVVALTAILALSLLGNVVPRAAQAQNVAPAAGSGGAVELAVARLGPGNTVEITTFFARTVHRTVADAPPGVDLKATRGTIVPRTESAVVTESVLRKHELDQLVARRLDGRQVTRDELRRRLAEPTAIVLASSAGRIDPVFARLLRPDALVVTLPPPSTVGPGPSPRVYSPVPLPTR